MAVSRSFKLGRYLGEAIADGVIESDGGLSEASVTASGGSGVTTYTTVDDLPTSGNSAGDLAFVDSSDRLYIYSGAGWYSVSLVNATPSISSVLDSDGGSAPFTLSAEGANTVITVTATDSDGLPITYSAVTDSDFTGLASISQSSNVFTVTPFSEDSATTTSGSVTFKASDGINVATSAATFTLTFSIVNSNYTALLVKAEGNSGTNTSITDSSTNSYTVTANGDAQATSFSPYRHGGYSTYFDGTGDFLEGPAVDLLGSGAFTVECWAYISSTETNYTDAFLAQYQTNSKLIFGVKSNVVRVWMSSTEVLVGTTNIIGEWHHFSLVRDASNNCQVYIDGIAEGSSFSNSTDFSTSLENFEIGSWDNGANSSLDGYITDLRVVKGTAVYTSAFTPPTDRLTAITNTSLLTCHLPYFADGSTNDHSITLNGNVSSKPFAPYDHDGYSKSSNGGSVYFDGTGDYLSIVDNAMTSTGEFTVEGWFYSTSATTQTIFHWSDISDGNDNDLILESNGAITCRVGSGGNTKTTSSTGLWLVNTWHHFAVVRNSSNNIDVYLDGASIIDHGTRTDDMDNTLEIGRNPYGGGANYLNGYISDFRIEESALYTSSFTPPTSPLSSTGTKLHVKGTDASIYDAAQSNALSVSGATSSTTQRKFSSSSAIVFDGTNDQIVTVPNQNIELGAKDFTFETWFWHSSTPATADTIFEICPTTTRFGPLLFYYSGGSNSWVIYSSSNGSSWNVASSFSVVAPTNSQWYHVAIAREGSSMKVFVDGTQVGSTISTSGVTFADSVVRLGYGYISSNGGNGNYFDGYIQDPRLTIGLARYTTTFTPPTTSLQG